MRFWWIFKAAIVRGLFAIALSLAFVTASYAQSQIDAVADYNAKEPLKSSVWGVFAVNMNGDTLVNYNGSQRMVPASKVDWDVLIARNAYYAEEEKEAREHVCRITGGVRHYE